MRFALVFFFFIIFRTALAEPRYDVQGQEISPADYQILVLEKMQNSLEEIEKELEKQIRISQIFLELYSPLEIAKHSEFLQDTFSRP